MKIVVGASSFAAKSDTAKKLLEDNGYEVVLNPYGRKMTEEEITEQLQGAVGILAGLEPLNENVISKAADLKAIARIGIGMDNVDIPYAESKGIKVSNTPSGPTAAVAEMTLAALLAIGRQIIPSNNDLHQKKWNKRIGFSLDGINVLLIGYGRIGQSVGEMLKKFNVNLMIYDAFQPDVSLPSLEDGLAKADVISLHASGKDEILSAEHFTKMKKEVVILNSARGALINEDALYNALNDGTVQAFWGDVFWEEPYTGKLCECENAILTPHIATYSKQCRESMEMEAAQNLLEDLK